MLDCMIRPDMIFSLPIAGLYLHTVTTTKLVVDTSRGGKLRINVRNCLCLPSDIFYELFFFLTHGHSQIPVFESPEVQCSEFVPLDVIIELICYALKCYHHPFEGQRPDTMQ